MKQSEARELITARITINANGCWIWPTESTYGHVNIDGKNYSVHRLSWLAHHGPINGQHVLHHCDVTQCVNPEHLFLGTHLDNMADMATKDRSGARAHRQPNRAKFTDQQIREIRAKHTRGFPISWLADEYQTSKQYMRAICNHHPRGRYTTRWHADQAST